MRHKGFIPWDDDIDVCMPRGDFDKFVTVAQNYLPLNMKVSNIVDGDLWGTIRISDIRHSLRRNYMGKNINYYVNIDIFPIDGLPDNPFMKRIHILRVFVSYLFFRITEIDNIRLDNKGKILKTIILIAKAIPFYKFINKNIALLGLNRSLSSYSYNNASTVWNFFSEYRMRTIIDKVCYGEGKKVCFEDAKFIIPDKAEVILKAEYGDYMKLPPKEHRKPKHKVVFLG